MIKSREERSERLWDSRFVKTIKTLAPGSPIRDGLENILRAKMGALVLVGDNPATLEIVDGGFELNSEYTPAGFYELAKMDGAIVLSQDGKRILSANTQLMPDPSIPTTETGTRHRTAERAAKQTGALVVAISQRRNIITVYLGQLRYTLKDIPVILNRANQALQTLEKYRNVLDKGLTNLSALEFEELVTLYDVALVLIRAEQVNRIAMEIERNVIELGSEGKLVSMQMEELISGVDVAALLIKDYCNTTELKDYELVREQIAELPEENLEPFTICWMLGYGVSPTAMDIPVVPRGYRVLRQISRLPLLVGEKLVTHFKTLQRIYNASLAELDEVEGIGEVRAKAVKDGLKRVREQALLDRHL
jgi:diadenylate cyclase